MPLPVTFATLTQGNQPLSLLDTQFAALGALVHIPCTAVGQNAVTLTTAVNTPTITAYTNLSPVFMWVQAQTSSGAVTIALSGLGAITAYRNNGQTAIGSGDLVAGSAYQAFYLSTLNSGNGGWVVDAFSTATSGGVLLSPFTISPATGDIVIPANATKAWVQMWGATGGSGSSGGANSSGGSGAGGYLEKLLTQLTPGNTLAFVKGTAGTAGSGGSGGNGGVTTLGAGTQTTSGGSPLLTLTCNPSNGTAASPSVGTAGGTAVNGDFNIQGQTGMGNSNATGDVSGGRNFFSVGADGVVSAGNGNAGNTGGIKITWFT